MTRKIVSNADSGDADTFGGDDVDNLMNDLALGPWHYDYLIKKSGSTYYAITKAGETFTSDANADVVVTDVLTQETGLGATLVFAPNTTYAINDPIVLPQSDETNLNQWRFLAHGTGGNLSGGVPKGTVTFMTNNNSAGLNNRCIIECLPSVGSGKRAALECVGINFYNPNVLTFNCGGIDLAADLNARFGHVKIENCHFRYCDRGLHLAGYFYHAIGRDLNFSDASTSFVGSYDIKIEKGGYPDKPDFVYFDNIHTSHIAGSSGTGYMTNEFYIESNYSTFSNFHADGWTYSEAPYKIVNCNGCTFFRLGGTDLNGANPGAFTPVATLYITATGSSTCKGNRFIKSLMSPYPVSGTRRTVYIDDADVTNNMIELEHFGSNAIIIDEAAGSQNVFKIVPGYHAGFTQAKPTVLNIQASSRIIDERGGAYNTGTSTQSGNASTTVFNIAHNCFTTPVTWTVTPTTADAKGTPVITADATNLIVTYSIAPPTGTNNLSWVWTAGVY